MLTVLYGQCVSSEGYSDVSLLLTAPQREMILQLASIVQENPSIFIRDYDSYTTDEIDDFLEPLVDAVMTDMTTNWLYNRIRFQGDDYDSITGTYQWVTNNNVYNNGYWQLTTAQNNQLTWNHISLKAGTYIIRMLAVKNSNCGIANFKINGSLVGTIDLYNATAQTNQKLDTSSFTISVDTEDVPFQVIMATKNASASNSGYFLNFHYIELIRTGP